MIGRIQIRTTMGQIGIRTEKANIEIENSLPKMTIRRKQAEFRIKSKPSKFKLDQSQYLVASGNMTTLFLSSTRFQKARQKTLDAIRRIAEEGDLLMEIEKKNNPIPEIALKNTIKETSVNIAKFPQNKIIWEKGYFELEWTPDELEFDWEINKPVIKASRPKVEIYMKRWPSIEISVVTDTEPLIEKYIEKKIGKNIDRKA